MSKETFVQIAQVRS